MAAGAVAQDTLHIRWPLEKYFSYQWPQSYYDSYNLDTFRTEISFWGSNTFNRDHAYYMYSKDSITIYGIAACLISEMDLNGYISAPCLDSTYNDVYDYLCVYEAGNGQLVSLRESKIHMHVTPISYYIDFDAYKPYSNIFKYPILPMYESYFIEPVTVIDSFYVGRHLHAHRNTNSNGTTTMKIYHATTDAYYSSEILVQPETYNEFDNYNYESDDSASYHAVYLNVSAQDPNAAFLKYIPLIFPILEPDTTAAGSDTTSTGDTVIVSDTTIVGGDTVIVSDTTIIGGDTIIVNDTTIVGGDTVITNDTILDIDQSIMLNRLTTLMPNPATETVKLLSSAGISRVEVYSMAGSRIYDKAVQTGSLSTTLDVRQWPSGTYMVRIHTPMGVVNKRLSVRR